MWDGFLKDVQPQLDWLQNSGIQRPAGDEDAGGVHAWLDEKTDEQAFLYSEITGYFMSLCTNLHQVQPDGPWKERAELAAEWITTQAQHKSGGILSRKYRDENATDDPYTFKRGRILYFDSAMVGFGLTNTYRMTKNERWLQAAEKLGQFCLTWFESEEDFYWAVDIHEEQRLDDAERWSQHFGPFEAKGMMFFDDLTQLTGDARYAEHADRVLVLATDMQREEGRFPTVFPDGRATHLHPHTYTVEGLLYLAARYGRPELLDRCIRAIDWSFKTCLLGDKRIHQWSKDPELCFENLRCDTLAQSIRAWAIVKALRPEHRFDWDDRIPSMVELLDTFKLESGGTAYGMDEYGAKLTHANSWCHFFALEARMFLAALKNGSLDARQLVIT